MSKERNIILTSINPYIHANARLRFYYSEDENNESQYCISVSDQEAGTKYVMSTNKIDTIIVVGSKYSCKEDLYLKEVDLKTTADFYSTNIDNADAYSQFAYRIAQFTNAAEIDGYKLYEEYSEQDRKIVEERFNKLAQETANKHQDSDKSRLFHYIRLDESSFGSQLFSIADQTNEYILYGVLGYAYSFLDSHYKMRSLICNDDIKMWFAPINKGVSDTSSITNIMYIFDWILSNEQDININIYLDTQGLNQTDSFALFQVVSMLSKQNNRIFLKDYITSNPYYNYSIRKVCHSTRPIDLNDLSSGINDFINFGKADMIVNYWNKYQNANDEYINNFVYAMRKIDIGISLCNYSELESGIKSIKRLIGKEYTPNEEDFEGGLFKILTHGIISDYGELLEGNEDEVDTFELIKWAYRKKYYQQAITFIESQIPDDIIKKGVWYYADNEEELIKVTNYVAEDYANVAPNLKYSFNDLNHYMIKNEGRNNIPSSVPKDKRNLAYTEYKISLLNDEAGHPYKAHTLVSDVNLVKNVFLQYYIVSNSRNNINHANRSTGACDAVIEDLKESHVWNQIETLIERFLNIYQTAVDDIGNKVTSGFELNYNQMSDVSYRLKKTNNNRGFRKPSRYSIICPDGYTAHCEDIKTWLEKYPHKHPELMQEPVDKVAEELMKTRDEYVDNKKEINYKGYRVLPTEYNIPVVKNEETKTDINK